MITITIPENAKQHAAAVQTHCDKIAERDPDWNGAEFDVEVGDYLAIGGDETVAAATLYHELVGLIS